MPPVKSGSVEPNSEQDTASSSIQPSSSTLNAASGSGTNSNTSNILKERRFKLSRACDRCRRRRIKCDEGHPCQACLTANSSCTFEEPGKRTHPHKSKRTSTLEDRMHVLETLIQAIPPAVFAASGLGAQAQAAVLGNTASLFADANAALNSDTLPPQTNAPGVPPPALSGMHVVNPAGYFGQGQNHDANGMNGMNGAQQLNGAQLNGAPQPNGAQQLNGLHGLDGLNGLDGMGGMNGMHGGDMHGARLNGGDMTGFSDAAIDRLSEETGRLSLNATYLYVDDEGYTRWQGETSGMPLLDLLVEIHAVDDVKGGGGASVAGASAGRMGRNGRSGGPGSDGTSSESGAQPDSPIDWFPNRSARRPAAVNPETLWLLVTSHIAPDLMDALVQTYLSTSYYLMPFLHIPTFLKDYGNPAKWGEPGFASFIVAICCLASRHTDDPRARADPATGTGAALPQGTTSDGSGTGLTAGTQWFELLGRLRTLPGSDRPTLYAVHAALVAGVYATGLGRLSAAAALISEASARCIDAGLHRSAARYDAFNPVEDEVRRRTFWCVYAWDKQLAAHLGRPPVLRLRDCDVGEPAPVDDEYVTVDGYVGRDGVTRDEYTPEAARADCRMVAFVAWVKMMVVLEAVLDVPPSREDPGSFLNRAGCLGGGRRSGRGGGNALRDEETMLDEVHVSVPAFWSHKHTAFPPTAGYGAFGTTPQSCWSTPLAAETLGSDDVIRVTQAVRLHCTEQFVRLLIYRHRISQLVAARAQLAEQQAQGVPTPYKPNAADTAAREREAMVSAHRCALQLVAAYLHVATRGLMTYYGVHVIHQLTQAGRTLVAVLLNCKCDCGRQGEAPSEANPARPNCRCGLEHLIPSAMDALRSCVGLLRRFSGRYVCGLRSGDLMEEFCRLTGIPLESSHRQDGEDNRPAWIRPVRKKSSMRSPSSARGAGDHRARSHSFISERGRRPSTSSYARSVGSDSAGSPEGSPAGGNAPSPLTGVPINRPSPSVFTGNSPSAFNVGSPSQHFGTSPSQPFPSSSFPSGPGSNGAFSPSSTFKMPSGAGNPHDSLGGALSRDVLGGGGQSKGGLTNGFPSAPNSASAASPRHSFSESPSQRFASASLFADAKRASFSSDPFSLDMAGLYRGSGQAGFETPTAAFPNGPPGPGFGNGFDVDVDMGHPGALDGLGGGMSLDGTHAPMGISEAELMALITSELGSQHAQNEREGSAREQDSRGKEGDAAARMNGIAAGH
ncbi:fungal-specific transcription factor domain-containing protein [Schizophyllum fasciatum]